MTDATLGRTVRSAAILAAIWTVPVGISVAGFYLGIMPESGMMPWRHIVGQSSSTWYIWILATPAIFAAYRRFPFDRGRLPSAFASHFAILVAAFLSQAWLTLVVGHATGHFSQSTTFANRFPHLVVQLLLYDVPVYGGILAVAVSLDYARRYRDRDLHASRLETQLERARLEALQTQLQPHFLFNALNSIAMLVRRERKQEALDVVIGFGELLRYVLSEAGTIDVTLAEELQFVQRYLDIETVRYGERLRVTVDIGAEARAALAPNLLLQPLVENALKHGIARLPDGGGIRISAKRVGDLLRIEVENDGPPLPEGFSLDTIEGIGLSNLRSRLAALFGEAGTLRLVDAPGGHGVLAAVDIPFRDHAGQRMARAG